MQYKFHVEGEVGGNILGGTGSYMGDITIAPSRLKSLRPCSIRLLLTSEENAGPLASNIKLNFIDMAAQASPGLAVGVPCSLLPPWTEWGSLL